MQLRRRYNDPQPSPARATYAPNTVTDNCKLVSRDGYAYPALIALGWTALVVEPDFVLMQAPAGWVVH